ncbi:replication factor C subunit 4-like [Oscarella lobularis]|uniref:replication factor C subunit 4-like n=1 Tax=Oscarella lobularis TaxID=121494 RepID=UPI003314338D
MDAFLGVSAHSKPKLGKTKEKREPNAPWVEKYRPKTVEDVSHQDEVVAVMKKVLEGADLPNLLFYGPPGTGKTSTILASARQLFSHDLYKDRVLELNASDERGIQVIRDKVKTFSRFTTSATRPDGRSCPPFKIIILDEADNMTSFAQAALRRTMEKETKTTRFCLICNYISRIIDPLTSRCMKFRFKPLSYDALEARLNFICEKERVRADDNSIRALIETSGGDLRKAITNLQSCHRLKGDSGITENDVVEVAGIIPPSTVENLLEVCHSDLYEKLDNAVKDLMADGYPAMQLVKQIHDKVLEMDLSDMQMAEIAERLAVIDKRLCDGADEYLQIMDLCSLIMQLFCHPS